MTKLPPSTRRRLQKLPQIPCVWEGDRRAVDLDPTTLEEAGMNGDCILWVDGSQGVVLAMDMVPEETGLEAIVRTLLRAMENPHNPARPARPQKIVVNDREVLFFLRGVLQELDIALEYVPELPLIDEIFRGFQEAAPIGRPALPPQYAKQLESAAHKIWEDAPWTMLGDHQILSVELNQWDIGTFYVSIMGMLGLDYGILLYRSLESLKQFRASVLVNESLEQLEDAFLSQDCLFITYEADDWMEEEDDDDFDLMDLPWSAIEPTFGHLHPLEGLRSFLYEEEASAVCVALEALHRFFQAKSSQLDEDLFPQVSGKYKIPLPVEAEVEVEAKATPAKITPTKIASAKITSAKATSAKTAPSLQVTVSTLPELAEELFAMVEDDEFDDDEDEDEDDSEYEYPIPLLGEDLVPPNAFLSLGIVAWETVELLRHTVEYAQESPVKFKGQGLPVVMIQTTRPKAKTMIEQLLSSGGLQGIGFNPGENPFAGESYDLGIFQTQDDRLHLFGEFDREDSMHMKARKKWDTTTKTTQGYCGLIIAMGATGASRGNPQPKDMLAFFETRSISAEELGLGLLKMVSAPSSS